MLKLAIVYSQKSTCRELWNRYHFSQKVCPQNITTFHRYGSPKKSRHENQAFGTGNPQHLHPTPSKYTHLKPAMLRPERAFNSEPIDVKIGKFSPSFWVKITSYLKPPRNLGTSWTNQNSLEWLSLHECSQGLNWGLTWLNLFFWIPTSGYYKGVL